MENFYKDFSQLNQIAYLPISSPRAFQYIVGRTGRIVITSLFKNTCPYTEYFQGNIKWKCCVTDLSIIHSIFEILDFAPNGNPSVQALRDVQAHDGTCWQLFEKALLYIFK